MHRGCYYYGAKFKKRGYLMKRICTHRNKKQQKSPYLGTLIEKAGPAAVHVQKVGVKPAKSISNGRRKHNE